MKTREVKRAAKVGDTIKIVDAYATGGKYKNGDMFTITELSVLGNPVVSRSCAHVKEYVVLEFYDESDQKIVITSDGEKTTARLYDYDCKVSRSASAKCSSTDTFSFAVGAKIAFERLMQDKPVPTDYSIDAFKYCLQSFKQDKPKAKQYREVKRHAIPGDKIKIVDAEYAFGDYKNGDILTVTRMLEKSVHPGAVVCDVPHMGYVSPSEYVVLEPITDKPTEPIKPAAPDYSTWRVVKRDPVVGDKVRVVKAYFTFGDYKNGDVLTVVRLHRIGQTPGTIKCDVPLMGVMNPDEYEILEPCPERMVRVFSKTAYNAFQHAVVNGCVGGLQCNPMWTRLVPASEVRK